MKKKILVLGVTGMAGHVIFMQMSEKTDLDVYATARKSNDLSQWFSKKLIKNILTGVDADNFDTFAEAFKIIKPDIVINCIGLIKQLPIASDPSSAIGINALLPHRIAALCDSANSRMIHISTDCVFDGSKGSYKEEDPSDAKDLYGRSKFLGEVEYPHSITLRTSMIGHELKGKLSLIEWFFAQKTKVRGFVNAIYSGLPTVELAKIIIDYVIPNSDLKGVYHVSSEPISKYDLLKLVVQKYEKKIQIEKYNDFYKNLSLDSSAFYHVTGYKSPSWPKLIEKMHKHYCLSSYYTKDY